MMGFGVTDSDVVVDRWAGSSVIVKLVDCEVEYQPLPL
jgi:hypothetical protein